MYNNPNTLFISDYTKKCKLHPFFKQCTAQGVAAKKFFGGFIQIGLIGLLILCVLLGQIRTSPVQLEKTHVVINTGHLWHPDYHFRTRRGHLQMNNGFSLFVLLMLRPQLL